MKTTVTAGYPSITDSTLDEDVYLHSLVAIGHGADPHKVYSDEYQVHHIDRNKWLNSDENLELVSNAEHRRIHRQELFEDEPYQNPEVLAELRDDGLTQYEIADELDCSQAIVSKKMKGFGLDTNRIQNKEWQNPDTLYEMYIERDMSMADMSDELDCSISSVSNWIDRHGIEARGHGARY